MSCRPHLISSYVRVVITDYIKKQETEMTTNDETLIADFARIDQLIQLLRGSSNIVVT
jgi:hypothetical protein